jgi:hypothetical protein
LKPLAGLGMPLVVALANPPQPDGSHVMVLLDHFHVVSAMYGELAAVAPVVGDRLGDFYTAATRDGQIARQHLYVSAVVVFYPRDESFIVSIYETPCYDATPLPASAFAGALNQRHGLLDDHGTYGVKATGPRHHE